MAEPIDPNKAVDFLLSNAGKFAKAKSERVHEAMAAGAATCAAAIRARGQKEGA